MIKNWLQLPQSTYYTPTMYYTPTPLFTPKFLHGYYSTCSIRPPHVFHGTLYGQYVHNFCPATCFRRRPILAADWHLPARRHRDSIQVEVPNCLAEQCEQSGCARLTYLRIGRTSVGDGNEQQVPSLDFSYLCTAELTSQATLPKDTGQRTRPNGRARVRGAAIASPRQCQCYVPHTQAQHFHNTTLADLVQPNVAVCVAVQLDGSV